MLAIKIILILLGLAFSTFGYFIFIRKKYSLINDFEANYKAGRKTEDYAKRVGLIELIVGIICLIVAVFLIIFG
jgi:small-conductance mechanosensitive channel